MHAFRLLTAMSVAAAAHLCGCAEAEVGPGGEGSAADGGGDSDPGRGGGSSEVVGLRDRLAQPLTFAVADRANGSRLHLTAVSLSDDVTASVSVEVLGGVVTLSLDDHDRVRFHELLVDADDVMVSPVVVPPDGLALTELAMKLAEPVSMQVGPEASDDHLAGGAELSIDVSWAVEVDRGVVDLAPIRLPALAFDVAVDEDEAGRLSAHLTASRPGPFWSWAGIFELGDLEIDLAAQAE